MTFVRVKPCKPSIKRLVQAMVKAGYKQFLIFCDGSFGWNISVSELVRDFDGKPALWGVVEKFGIGRGGGGRMYKQIREFPGLRRVEVG